MFIAIMGIAVAGVLTAYDVAEESELHAFQPPLSALGLAEIKYLRVLALTRSGGLRRASAEAAALAAALPADLPPALAEDIAALSARRKYPSGFEFEPASLGERANLGASERLALGRDDVDADRDIDLGAKTIEL